MLYGESSGGPRMGSGEYAQQYIAAREIHAQSSDSPCMKEVLRDTPTGTKPEKLLSTTKSTEYPLNDGQRAIAVRQCGRLGCEVECVIGVEAATLRSCQVDDSPLNKCEENPTIGD